MSPIKGENLSLFEDIARKSAMKWAVNYIQDKHLRRNRYRGNFTAEDQIQMMNTLLPKILASGNECAVLISERSNST